MSLLKFVGHWPYPAKWPSAGHGDHILASWPFDDDIVIFMLTYEPTVITTNGATLIDRHTAVSGQCCSDNSTCLVGRILWSLYVLLSPCRGRPEPAEEDHPAARDPASMTAGEQEEVAPSFNQAGHLCIRNRSPPPVMMLRPLLPCFHMQPWFFHVVSYSHMLSTISGIIENGTGKSN